MLGTMMVKEFQTNTVNNIRCQQAVFFLRKEVSSYHAYCP